MKKLILASRSPRRAELLQQLGLRFELDAADIDETPRVAEEPAQYVDRMALEKALVVAARHPESVVIGSDTSVIAAGNILGKPESEAQAQHMWSLLSGSVHQVVTSVAVVVDGQQRVIRSTTDVFMRSVNSHEMAAYWRTGEPLGKAGGYAIQGLAAVFIERIEGSYSAVMGLPLAETANLLAEVGVGLPSLNNVG